MLRGGKVTNNNKQTDSRICNLSGESEKQFAFMQIDKIKFSLHSNELHFVAE